MARNYTVPTPGQKDTAVRKRLDKQERQRVDVPRQLHELDNVEAFNVTQRQIMAFNKYTGVWEPFHPDDLPFGFLDPLVLGKTFAYKFREDHNVVGFSLTCHTAGVSGTTTVAFEKNGVSLFTLSLGVGVLYNNTEFDPVGFTARVDTLTMNLTAKATGVAGLGGGLELN